MDKLKVHLENCYGIKKLIHEFDFSEGNTIVIYAPNGVMKSSFAKTFEDLSNDKQPYDRMDESAKSVFDVIQGDTDSQIINEEICVVQPFNEKEFDSEGNILLLLANDQLRQEYKDIHDELNLVKTDFIKKLKRISKSSNCEQELITTFQPSDGKVFEALLDLREEVRESKTKFNFKYNDIFDPAGKVKIFLESNNKLFEQYIDKYSSLIGESEFFSKNADTIFGTTEAKNIKASIEGNEFFSAGHRFYIREYGEISDKDVFNEILDKEINKIFSDNDLRKIFDEIDKKLGANRELKAFKKEIEKDNSLVLKLKDYEGFRKEVWFSYLKQIENDLSQLIDLYIKKKPDLEDVVKKASKDQSEWNDAINEFNNRFVNQPFSLDIENKSDAVLDMDLPVLTFKFENKSVERKKLLEILSQGEKRAFYILNIVFKIRAREVNGERTLFIFDDVADSFDYKNKYAIVEYLHDLTKNKNFSSIILTHNFDFFRSICGRLSIPEKQRFYAQKDSREINLYFDEAICKIDPFKGWKKKLDYKHIIVLVPFVRNLIEYGKNERRSFLILTHLLHLKKKCKYHNNGNLYQKTKIGEYDEANGDFSVKATEDITFGDLEQIYHEYLGVSFSSDIDKSISVKDKMLEEVKKIDDSTLESKILLAITIRIIAENFMITIIDNPNFTDYIRVSQTASLFNKVQGKIQCGEISLSKDQFSLLESVNIITPENIHINSFMYEPIVDMGIEELRTLYNNVCKLK